MIVLVMVLLSVANTVNMALHERVGEFGTMMALGNRRGFIFRMIVLESGLLGVIGAALGLVLGLLLAWGISLVGIPMPPPPNWNVGYTAAIQDSLSRDRDRVPDRCGGGRGGGAPAGPSGLRIPSSRRCGRTESPTRRSAPRRSGFSA